MPDLQLSLTAELSPIDDERAAPIVRALVERRGARWVDAGGLDEFLRRGGDQALFFQGDPVRFPQSLDVAVVLPELQSAAERPFEIGVVCRADEDAIARRFGSTHWPALVFVRDGAYVGELAGMHDWRDYVDAVNARLRAAPRRAPTIGIPVVAAGAAGCA